MRCPSCEKTKLVPIGHTHVTRVGRYKVTDGSVLVPTCRECGEVVLSEELLRGYELRAAALVLRSAKAVAGEEIRAVRKSLGLRQTDLAEVLGHAAETISRQETGVHPIARVDVLALLGIVDEALSAGGDVDIIMKRERARSLKKALVIPDAKLASGG